jgi:hypothetical protein
MMKSALRLIVLSVTAYAVQGQALSLAPEEFAASTKLACVLAQQSLGQLSEAEYGEQANAALDGFDESERSNILAKALGYYEGLMFTPTGDPAVKSEARLEDFVASRNCSADYQKATFRL